MKIDTQFHGILTDWVGIRSASFELADGATYADLMKEIKRRYHKNMPDQLWDREKNTFHSKVRAFKQGKALNSMELQLMDGDELIFFLLMAGG